ncbi:Alkaline protease secretion protein AprE [Liberibacter crescens BT-1]|uniref:Alkaline protease secretion protein AprE n=1 Tax=Liberibacter crescens (strain BT-1) TaxID=1215343 RepID=L0EUL4_LIBCB|nr:Alkaline protease secretion protein AprE [Liberibacter crescens BT-1]
MIKLDDLEIRDQIDIIKEHIANLTCHINNTYTELNLLKQEKTKIEKAISTYNNELLLPLKNYIPECKEKISNYDMLSLFELTNLKIVQMRNIFSDYRNMHSQESLSKILLESQEKDLKKMQTLFTKNLTSETNLHQQERQVHTSRMNLMDYINKQKTMLGRLNELYNEATLEVANYKKNKSHELYKNQRMLADEKSKLISLEKNLLQHTIRSPITGTVIYTNSFITTNYTQQSQLLMKLSPHTTLNYIRAKVAPHQIQNVKSGEIATIRFPTYSKLRDSNFKALIDTISPIISQDKNNYYNQNYYEVILKISDPSYDTKKTDLYNGSPAEILFSAENTTLASVIMHPITKNWPKIFER